MVLNMSKECKNKLLEAMQDILDTRDKMYMFLRMEFKRLLPLINIEGSSSDASFNIYEEFRKQGMLTSLMGVLNSKFNTNLNIEIE